VENDETLPHQRYAVKDYFPDFFLRAVSAADGAAMMSHAFRLDAPV
jgi:hypothetical protein